MKPKNYPFTSFSFLIWRFNSPDSLLSSPLLSSYSLNFWISLSLRIFSSLNITFTERGNKQRGGCETTWTLSFAVSLSFPNQFNFSSVNRFAASEIRNQFQITFELFNINPPYWELIPSFYPKVSSFQRPPPWAFSPKDYCCSSSSPFAFSAVRRSCRSNLLLLGFTGRPSSTPPWPSKTLMRRATCVDSPLGS